MYCSPWGHRELDMIERLNGTELTHISWILLINLTSAAPKKITHSSLRILDLYISKWGIP